MYEVVIFTTRNDRGIFHGMPENPVYSAGGKNLSVTYLSVNSREILVKNNFHALLHPYTYRVFILSALFLLDLQQKSR